MKSLKVRIIIELDGKDEYNGGIDFTKKIEKGEEIKASYMLKILRGLATGVTRAMEKEGIISK